MFYEILGKIRITEVRYRLKEWKVKWHSNRITGRSGTKSYVSNRFQDPIGFLQSIKVDMSDFDIIFAGC